MFNRGFGGFGGLGGSGAGGDFEQMARQYWTLWEQALRGAVPATAPAAPPGSQAWQEALQSWTDVFAHRPVTNDVMARFGQQARQWYAQIQQVAAQFGGQGGRPEDVVAAWKTALGGPSANLFQSLFDSMNGPGLYDLGHWLRSVQPLLDALTGKGDSLLNIPAFGFTREHQERLQALAAAQMDVQQATKAYQDLMLKTSQAAFQRFEQKLTQCAKDARPVETPRALFDLWVDAAEDAYADVALSDDYRHAYGDLLNAQIRLRAGIQQEVEHFSAQLGMPTRSELDGAHRKIVELERELRRLRERTAAPVAPRPEQPPAPRPVVAKKTAKTAVKKAAKNTAKKTVRPPAAKTAQKTPTASTRQ